MDDIPQLLLDDTRYKIFQFTLKHGETTTNEYLEILNISRSTLSHHLTKLVEANVLQVRVAETGRPQKFWSLNPKTFLIREKRVISKDLDQDELLELFEEHVLNQLLKLNLLNVTTKDIIEREIPKKVILNNDSFTTVHETNEEINIFPIKMEFADRDTYESFISDIRLLLAKYNLEEQSNSSDMLRTHVIYAGGHSLPKELKFEKKVKHEKN